MMPVRRSATATVLTTLILGPLTPAAGQETHLLEQDCGEESSPILVLGTYHMANPGLDSHNVEADDVRSPRRQAEIAELLDRLQLFAPTLVAVEAKYGEGTWPERYVRYLEGDHELGRNEIDQVAFRLAARLGLATVYPVDWPMWMNGWRNDEIDWEAVRVRNAARAAAADDDAGPKELTESQRRLLESTVSEYLAWLNGEDRIRRGHETYMRMLLPSDGPGIYARTDEVANWYERNLRIFTNLNRVTEHGRDRVLLLVGAGHLQILRDFAVDSPYFCLADTRAYLELSGGEGPPQRQ